MKVGDRVRISGKYAKYQHYVDYLGIGVVVRVTNKRIVVKWSNGGRSRNHSEASLQLEEPSVPRKEPK